MKRQDKNEPQIPELNELPPIPLPDLNDDSNKENDELSRFHRDPYATGGAFWAEALREAARPGLESTKIEELVETLGKDPGVQERLIEEDDLEFGD